MSKNATRFTVDDMGNIRLNGERVDMGSTAVLVAIVNGELDMKALANAALKARGLDNNGKFVPFSARRGW
jgi:hypothetical protein